MTAGKDRHFNTPMKYTYIYILSDPTDNMIRYVGKTNNPQQRYKAHTNKCRDKNTHKRNWINTLRDKGLKPNFFIIDKVDVKEWKYWEKYYITLFTSLGAKLTNKTDGGDGLTFGNQTSFKKGDGARVVLGIDRNGNIIHEFQSATEASISLGLHRSTIGSCASGHSKLSRGLAWIYKDDFESMSSLDLSNELDRRFTKIKSVSHTQFKKGQPSMQAKMVVITNMHTGESIAYSSFLEAASFLGVTPSAISYSIRNNVLFKSKTYKATLYESKDFNPRTCLSRQGHSR